MLNENSRLASELDGERACGGSKNERAETRAGERGNEGL